VAVFMLGAIPYFLIGFLVVWKDGSFPSAMLRLSASSFFFGLILLLYGAVMGDAQSIRAKPAWQVYLICLATYLTCAFLTQYAIDKIDRDDFLSIPMAGLVIAGIWAYLARREHNT